ncbi:MAG: chromosomal replication initiator protein DnaA [Oscillibacter sp.]|nr:chromosomal replication initiator protein DnaA [Oscillibacter sp.]MBQ2996078.1 chromosomal replication initiator protein DnaA [Oscillibacter sp.]
MNNIADLWKTILGKLQNELSETTISTWFDELDIVDFKGNALVLHCANSFKKGAVESLYMDNIKAVLRDMFSRDFEITILDDTAYMSMMNSGNQSKRQSDRFTSDEFTFDTFVVGPSNKLAHAASKAVADHPAQNYNPLLIYGDSGLGKTHLIYAIANVIRRNDPNARIAYVKGDELTNELVRSIQEGPHKTAEMREKYRQADLLLVDDVQFIAGKKQTQEEFFHTFNTLYESGKQIVLTSDRPPSEMTMLEDRLRTRFEWGLLVDVAPPDFETRLAIIKNKAALLGLELPDRVCAYIAEHVTANVRQIEGTINKVMAFKDLLGNDADEESVARAIQDIVKRSNEYIPTPEAILEYISKYYNVDESVIKGQQRNRDATQARQVAMYLIRNMTTLSLEDIGRVFDNRDHSTVLYSIQQVEKKMKTDNAFAEKVKAIKTNINSKR